MVFRDITFRSFLAIYYNKWDPRGMNRGPSVSENKHKRHTPKHYKNHLKIQLRSNYRNYSFSIAKPYFWVSGGTLKPVRGAATKSWKTWQSTQTYINKYSQNAFKMSSQFNVGSMTKVMFYDSKTILFVIWPSFNTCVFRATFLNEIAKSWKPAASCFRSDFMEISTLVFEAPNV